MMVVVVDVVDDAIAKRSSNHVPKRQKCHNASIAKRLDWHR